MPSLRISASRHGGTCRIGYAHDIRIRPGQRTLVTTYFDSDEHVRDFGVEPLSRHRVCSTCTASKLKTLNRAGALHTVAGLTVDDLIEAGILTSENADPVREQLAAVISDWGVVAADMQVAVNDFGHGS